MIIENISITVACVEDLRKHTVIEGIKILIVVRKIESCYKGPQLN